MNKIKQTPVIIDCDPGIDDAVALTVAFAHKQLNILAVTTVAGNVPVEKTTANAAIILSLLGANCGLYKGAAHSLLSGEQITAADIHGAGGLGNFAPKSTPHYPVGTETALEAQRRLLQQSEEPVTFIALGPLTNLGLLLRSYPSLASKIKQISLMGGGITGGNYSPAAEFNIAVDPEAADIVFASGIPIIMAGLDVTSKAIMKQPDLAALQQVNNPVANMLCSALEFYFASYTQDSANSACCMHDTVAVLALVQPQLMQGENYHVVVETGGRFCRGFTLADRRHFAAPAKANCHVLLDIDAKGLNAAILKAAGSYT